MNIALMFANEQQIHTFSIINPQIRIYIICELPTEWGKQNYPLHISFQKAKQMYMDGLLDKIVIFSIKVRNLDYFYQKEMIPYFNENDILYVSKQNLIEFRFKIDELSPFSSRLELDYLSVQISNQCNLKCAHCSSMIGLESSIEELSFDKTIDSIAAMNKLFSSINHFQILGGEPFLNPRLTDYLIILRKLYPHSTIDIITNGTLLLCQSETTYQIIHDYSINVMISYYPILASVIDRIHQELKQYDIKHSISDRIDYFQILYDFHGYSNEEITFNNCQSAQYCKNGLTLYEEYLYPCLAPLALYRARVISDPREYGVKISERTKIHEIKTLIHPMSICKYCHMDQFQKWHQLEGNTLNCLSNWSI